MNVNQLNEAVKALKAIAIKKPIIYRKVRREVKAINLSNLEAFRGE